MYLIHLTQPLAKKNAQVRHYLGFTSDFNRRLKEHIEHRNGSPLVHAALESGSGLIIAAIWYGVNQKWERFLKNKKQTSGFCPICHGREPMRYNDPDEIPFY